MHGKTAPTTPAMHPCPSTLRLRYLHRALSRCLAALLAGGLVLPAAPQSGLASAPLTPMAIVSPLLSEPVLVDDLAYARAPRVVATPDGRVLLGSGDRSNPNAVNNSDRFYMLRDRQIKPFTTAPPTSGECSDSGSPKYRDVRCTWPITDSGLVDVTTNLVQDGNSSQVSTAVAALRPSENPRADPSYGWRLSLETSGEKSLSQALTVAGRVMFTTFSPAASGTVSDSTCVPALGTGRLYVVGLQDARSVLDLSLLNGTTLAKADRVRAFNSLIPDTPTMFHAKDGSIHGILPDGETLRLPARLQRVRTYWYELDR